MTKRAREAALKEGWGHDTATLNRVLDAYEAALKADGYKLVRREATEEMAEADASGPYGDDRYYLRDDEMRAVWSAMWDAAPDAGQ